VWIAPVLPESATHRFARAFHGRIAGWIAAWLYDDISDVDVVEVLRDAQVPGVVIASPEDGLLTAEERAAIAGAISPAAGFMERDGGHVVLATEAHALLREELPVFVPCCTPEHVEQRVGAVLAELPPGVSARFPDGSAERTRLEQLCRLQRGARADSVAAAALAIPHAEIAARVLWLHSYRSYYTLEFDEWLAAMSLDDPAGQLPIELIERASLLSDFSQEFGFGRKAYTAAAIEAAGVAGGAHASHVDDRTVVEAGDEPVILSLDGRAMFEELLARGLDVADAERQFVRILLKSQRIPDRLRIAPDGRVAVEVKEKGTWRTLAMDPARIDLAPIPMMYEIRLTDSVPSEAGTSTFKIRSR
jgi:hypothetical protein